MTKEEENKIIDKMFEEQTMCSYCKYSYVCDGTIRPDGGGNLIYPPCWDNDMKIAIFRGFRRR